MTVYDLGLKMLDNGDCRLYLGIIEMTPEQSGLKQIYP